MEHLTRMVKEMIEFAKSFFMMVGTITTALVFTYFVLKLEEKFKSYRKNGCKFKCLCKHVPLPCS